MSGSSSVRGDQTIYHTDNLCFDGTDRGSPMSANGQLWIGATASDRANNGGHVRLGSLTSTTLTIGYSAPNITINTAGGGAPIERLTGDTGTAAPVAGNIKIAGGPGVTTSATGAVVTINSVVFTDTTATTFDVDNGYNATAAGTYNMPATAAQGELIIVFCDTAGAVVLDAPALNFIRIGSLITSSGGTVTSTSIGDSLTLRYRLSSLTWEATSVIGTWLVA